MSWLVRWCAAVHITMGFALAAGPSWIPAPPEDCHCHLAGYVFQRLFGTALGVAGLLVLHLERALQPALQRPLIRGLFLFNVLLGVMTVIQQVALPWALGDAGWIFAAAFLLLAAGCAYQLLGRRGAALAEAEELSKVAPDGLQKRWKREIAAAAAQEERARLARELHDSIKQQLFTIQVSAAASQARLEADPAGAQAALEDVRRGAREGMAEMEALLASLQPAPLANLGLGEALRKQCEALGYRSGARVEFELGSLASEESLPPGANEAVFRIAQEALANVARHARAENVRVRLGGPARASRALLELEIADDGSGFAAGGATSGMGLDNMRSRARAIGAQLALDSRPGGGTRLVLRVPHGRRGALGESTRWAALAGGAGVLLLGLAWRFQGQEALQAPLVFAGVAALALGAGNLLRLRARPRWRLSAGTPREQRP